MSRKDLRFKHDDWVRDVRYTKTLRTRPSPFTHTPSRLSRALAAFLVWLPGPALALILLGISVEAVRRLLPYL